MKEISWRVILTLIVLAMMYDAAKGGPADFYVILPHLQLNEWAAVIPSPSELENAEQRLEEAYNLYPANPSLSEDLARLHFMKAKNSVSISQSEKQAELHEALSKIRESIGLRRVSPQSWALLVCIKQHLGEYDTEFGKAIEHAVFQGPWEPYVQFVVADAGLDGWQFLSDSQRTLVLQDITRGNQYQADNMLKIQLKVR